MTSVKRRRDKVEILGFDVAGKLSNDIVKNTAMSSNNVMAYPTLSSLFYFSGVPGSIDIENPTILVM